MLGNAAPSPESSPHYALAHFRQELTWQHRGISYKLVIFRVAAAGTRAEGLGRRLRRGWGSCRRTAPATGVNNFSLFLSPEKASSEQKRMIQVPIGSPTGFESASGSRGFCTRMWVWAASGGSVCRSAEFYSDKTTLLESFGRGLPALKSNNELAIAIQISSALNLRISAVHRYYSPRNRLCVYVAGDNVGKICWCEAVALERILSLPWLSPATATTAETWIIWRWSYSK